MMRVLQFTVRGTLDNFCLSVAYYEYWDGSAARLGYCFWEVMHQLDLIGLRTHCAVLDGASSSSSV